MDETEQFSLAIEEAVKLTNRSDTLIIVTSDHAHTMSYGGYPKRGNDIFGFAGKSDVDDKPYSTLSYANGPGYKHPTDNGERYDITDDHMRNYFLKNIVFRLSTNNNYYIDLVEFQSNWN